MRALVGGSASPPPPRQRQTATPTSDPEPYTSRIEGFELDLLTLERKCYDSASCTVTVQVDLSTTGIRGGEKPQLYNPSVQGEKCSADAEERAAQASLFGR